MKSYMNIYLCRVLWLTCAISLVVGLTTIATGQVMIEQERKLIVGKQQFDAKVLQVEAHRLEFQLTEPKDQRMIMLRPELLAKLRLVPGLSYNVLTNQRQTPGGISAAVRLKDERGLYAIAESIQDISLLLLEEREGIKVEQLPTQSRTLVYEDNCKTVYNVPTAFTIENQRMVLQAYETKTVHIGNAGYTLFLNSSQFVILKECPTTFEGGRSLVEYTIVRNQ